MPTYITRHKVSGEKFAIETDADDHITSCVGPLDEPEDTTLSADDIEWCDGVEDAPWASGEPWTFTRQLV